MFPSVGWSLRPSIGPCIVLVLLLSPGSLSVRAGIPVIEGSLFQMHFRILASLYDFYPLAVGQFVRIVLVWKKVDFP